MPVLRRSALAAVLLLTAAPAFALPPGATKDLPPPPKDAGADAPARSDATLAAVIASPDRPANERARDVYRHPEASLLFWGLRPGVTFVDLQPGGGYWTQIVAPYLAKVGGTYVAGVADLDNPKVSAGARKGRADFEAKFADKARYGTIRYVGFGPVSGPIAPPNSVDIILTSREFHNWVEEGYVDRAMKAAYDALKPGGVLAVEEHRADPKPETPKDSSGYVATSSVVAAATKAGFQLDDTSEINANPKDDKDHPFGVWTLPPTRTSAEAGKPTLTPEERAKYDAIGESDRMTLRFKKPG
jgi:predicted methyltransferase